MGPPGPAGPTGPQGPIGPNGWLLNGNSEASQKSFGTLTNLPTGGKLTIK